MKIEVYEPKSKINAKSPNVLADTQTFTREAEALTDTGKVLSEIGDKMMEAQIFKERLEAKTKSQRQINDILLQSEQDPDINNYDKYAEALGKVKDESLKNMRLRRSREAFELEFESDRNQALMKMGQDKRKKIITQSDALIQTNFKDLEDQYIRSGNAVVQKQTIDSMNAILEEAGAKGIYAADEVMKRKNAINGLPIKKFYADLNAFGNSPESIDSLISGLQSGHYDEQFGMSISPKVKTEMIDRATALKNKRLREFDYNTKVNQQKNEHELGLRATGKKTQDGQPNPPTHAEIDEAMINKAISPQYAKLLHEYITSPNGVNAKNKASVYASLMSEYSNMLNDDGDAIAEGDFTKLSNFRAKVIEAGNKGSITPSSAQKMLNMIQPSFEEGVAEQYKNSALVQKTTILGFDVWTKDHLKTKAEQDEAKMYLSDNLMTKIQAEQSETGRMVSPDRISELSREIIKDYIRMNVPELLTSKEVTNNVMSKDGGLKNVTKEGYDAKADQSIGKAPKKEISQEDLEYTAQKYGLTVEEVKARLGAKDNAS